jgi:hypothetical protein
MSRYSVVGSAAECEPGSNGLVLRNRLGIKDPAVMEVLERDLLLLSMRGQEKCGRSI